MEYDLFICHASEDKESFVRDLAECLRAKGLSVWYDEFALRLGDSLSEAISRGLASSRFGVVIISPHFIRKKWPRRELAALLAREDEADKVILPIWHLVSKQDLLMHLPLLADKVAARSIDGVEVVSGKICQLVNPGRLAELQYQRGFELEREGDVDGARSCYIDALLIDRNHANALQRLVAIFPVPALHKKEIILGRVKWYGEKVGFGWITAEDGKDCFVHISSLERQGIKILHPGDCVAFMVWSKGKMQIAVAVRSISTFLEAGKTGEGAATT